ncbi:hypothetical protein [Streptomyces sp. E-08]|uniref:hypothetical protein n=1 Tax=Streptomyces sp. E-08 TaxID=3404047 RepID=UPI003CE7B19F
MVVCTAHGPLCKKYPDHPVIRAYAKHEWNLFTKPFIEMAYGPIGELDTVEVPCETRKLSDEQIRNRREYADAVHAAQKKNRQIPSPPWMGIDVDKDLAALLSGLNEHHTQHVPDFEEME